MRFASLRVVRFRAQIEGQYHPDTYTALKVLAPLVEGLSGSRQLEELEKVLRGRTRIVRWRICGSFASSRDFFRSLLSAKAYRSLRITIMKGMWEHMLRIMRAFRDEDGTDVRIAALFHDSGKAKTFFAQRTDSFRPSCHSLGRTCGTGAAASSDAKKTHR